MKIAYIAYVIDQGEPSKPEIATLDLKGNLREQLIELWKEAFDPEEGDERLPLKFWKRDDHGDLCVEPKDGDDDYLFVTFEDADREKAMRQIRPKTPKWMK